VGKALLVSPQRARWSRNLALMFDRVTIRVLDLEASERFYRGTLNLDPPHKWGCSVR
jgi:catechol-2,3-dioxygenase